MIDILSLQIPRNLLDIILKDADEDAKTRTSMDDNRFYADIQNFLDQQLGKGTTITQWIEHSNKITSKRVVPFALSWSVESMTDAQEMLVCLLRVRQETRKVLPKSFMSSEIWKVAQNYEQSLYQAEIKRLYYVQKAKRDAQKLQQQNEVDQDANDVTLRFACLSNT